MQTARLATILVVEDEPLVAMDIVDCLTDAGYGVLGPIDNLSKALRVVLENDFDSALLDANLGGEKVDELAAALTAKNIPFAFVTGYARDKLSSAFKYVPLVSKPFNHESLNEVVRNLLDSRVSKPPPLSTGNKNS